MKKFGTAAGVMVAVFAVAVAIGQTQIPIRVQPFLSGLSSPVLVTNADDGTRRLFIVQQGGIIKVLQAGSTAPTDFMNITTRVLSGGERGLLGLAFHPQFETNHYFFVNYTRQTDGATVVARYTATNNNTLGDPNSERILLTIAQPFSNHNGGMIEFGPDGHLYIGMGDGGSGNDPGNRAQNINELLGKFLRITPDVSGSTTTPPYTVPSDNPYVGVPGADEIYAIGLRNPWRWSFDRMNGQLWAGDVGQGAIEETSIITLGGNFGWRVYEGTQCTNLDPGLCIPANYTMPVFQYSSASPSSRCSITGGYVYRGVQRALPQGSYLYGDYCTGEVLLWHNNQQNLLVDTSRSISSFGEDEDGELYIVGLGGTVDKILGARVSADFDGDNRSDLSVFRPSNSVWYIQGSGTGVMRAFQFGLNTDVPVPEDYDGDNMADPGVFRPSNGTWYYLRSTNSTIAIVPWGLNGDIPAAGDYDGDSRADLTVFRPSTGVWYTLRSSNSTVSIAQFGLSADIPTVSDFDGDGRNDIALWRPSEGNWYWLNSSNGAFGAVHFGLAGDIPAQGDLDGDGKTDHAVFRPSTGVWYIFQSSNSEAVAREWGIAEDIPVTGDYDGDGRDDIGVFRPSNGIWYIIRSSSGSSQYAQWGINGDRPIPAFDAP